MAQTTGAVFRDLGASSDAFTSRTPLPFAASGAIVAAAEFLLIILAAVCCGVLYHLAVHGNAGSKDEFLGVGALVAVVYLTRMQAVGAYDPVRLASSKLDLFSIVSAWIFAFAALAVAAYLLKIGHILSRGFTVSFAIVGFGALLPTRSIAQAFVRWAHDAQVFNPRRALVLGDPSELSDGTVTERLRRSGYQIEGVVPLEWRSEQGLARSVAMTVAQTRTRPIEEILLCVNWSNLEKIEQLLAGLRVLPIPVLLIADRRVRSILTDNLASSTVLAIEVQRTPLTVIERGTKRAFDVTCAALGLVLLTPLLAVVAAAIRLESPGPVLFRQTRVGFGGRPFRIFKFRTMTVTEDGPTLAQATRDDKRVTRVGRFLRKTSIDEIPQLLNVLKGEMSLVGPRPHALAHDNQYNRLITHYCFRHHMKPGITGWAQVSGFRGETPTVDLMARRVDHDLWYINNWTIWLDIRTLFLTVIRVPLQKVY